VKLIAKFGMFLTFLKKLHVKTNIKS
jgi:hypothetical protein